MASPDRGGATATGRSARIGPVPAALVLFLGSLAVYWRARGFGFVSFDDGIYVYANRAVLDGISLQGIGWAFSNVDAGIWIPLTWLSLMADSTLFGTSPAGYHLTNILLHGAGAALLFLVLRGATGAAGRSFVAAALFALHPLNVESVAWVTERKNVLSMVLMLAALLAYLRYTAGRRRSDYAATAGLFLLALLAKPMVVTFPLLLLLLDRWPLGRFADHGAGRLVREKVPLLLLSAWVSAVTILGMRGEGALFPLGVIPASLRAQNALAAMAAYLRRLVWPGDLNISQLFPFEGVPAGRLAAAAVVVAAVSALAWRERSRRPYLLTGWLWYLVALLPVSGLLQNGPHGTADRFAYLPMVGPLVAVVWLAEEAGRGRRLGRGLAVAAAVAAILASGAVTSRQLGYWRDSETLFRRALAVDAENWLVANYLGAVLAEQGRLDEAIPLFEVATRHNPGHAIAHFNLGLAKELLGRCREAVPHYERALRLKPDDPEIRRRLEGCRGR